MGDRRNTTAPPATSNRTGRRESVALRAGTSGSVAGRTRSKCENNSDSEIATIDTGTNISPFQKRYIGKRSS